LVKESPVKDQGQHEDFEQVVLAHLGAARNLARRLVRDATMAEDVVQDACERACKYFASFRGGSGRPWLLRIVRNAAYSMLKEQRQGLQVSASSASGAADEGEVGLDLPDPGPDPETTLAQRQDVAALDDALNALPATWRRCLVLREVDALSYTEIARTMAVPIGTVMSSISRARRALQRRLFAERTRISPGRSARRAGESARSLSSVAPDAATPARGEIDSPHVGGGGCPEFSARPGSNCIGALDITVTPDGRGLFAIAPRGQQIVSFKVEYDGNLTRLGAASGVPGGNAGLAAN
jgi:RNA polymerase sigma-70 factor (ECF subfamily)